MLHLKCQTQVMSVRYLQILSEPGLPRINQVIEPHACCWNAKRCSRGLFNKPTCWRHGLQSARPLDNNQNQSRNVHLLWVNQREKKLKGQRNGLFNIRSAQPWNLARIHEPWWFLIITILDLNSEVEREKKKEKNVVVQRERGGQRVRER